MILLEVLQDLALKYPRSMRALVEKGEFIIDNENRLLHTLIDFKIAKRSKAQPKPFLGFCRLEPTELLREHADHVLTILALQEV